MHIYRCYSFHGFFPHLLSFSMKVAIKGIFFKDEELFSEHQFKLKTLITQSQD